MGGGDHRRMDKGGPQNLSSEGKGARPAGRAPALRWNEVIGLLLFSNPLPAYFWLLTQIACTLAR